MGWSSSLPAVSWECSTSGMCDPQRILEISESQKIQGIALIHREAAPVGPNTVPHWFSFLLPSTFPTFLPLPNPLWVMLSANPALPVPRGSQAARARKGWRDVTRDITHGRCGRGSLRRRISKSSFQQNNNSGISPSLTPSLPTSQPPAETPRHDWKDLESIFKVFPPALSTDTSVSGRALESLIWLT